MESPEIVNSCVDHRLSLPACVRSAPEIGARRFLVDAPERRSAAGGRGLEQRPIEDLEKPAAGDRPRVVMDENGGRNRVRDVTVDGGHAREGRVDGRAPAGVPTDQSVAEPDASGQLVYDLPRREHGPVALDAPALDPVAERQGQIEGSGVVGSAMAVGRPGGAGRSSRPRRGRARCRFRIRSARGSRRRESRRRGPLRPRRGAPRADGRRRRWDRRRSSDW